MTEEQWIGTKEAAGILGVDKSTVTRHANEGRLPFQKLPGPNGAMLFQRTDVLRIKTTANPSGELAVGEEVSGGDRMGRPAPTPPAEEVPA